VPRTDVEGTVERFRHAYNRRNWGAVRAVLADDLVIDDQRPARGFPDVRDADDFVGRLKAGVEAIPDRGMGPSTWLALEGHGGVGRFEFRGHEPVGGGEIAGDRIFVVLITDGRYRHLAFFEPEHETEALTYFAALPRPAF
jgi:hypothetical protein